MGLNDHTIHPKQRGTAVFVGIQLCLKAFDTALDQQCRQHGTDIFFEQRFQLARKKLGPALGQL
ncbi:hypothetical protein SDC9_172099 [bioreactor metagenome]|uniref:Uncharacterized protein n=1 Tax=bioreactor metagenome TaxID=1076179 RepID=A0A645GCS4_9ZZZZ